MGRRHRPPIFTHEDPAIQRELDRRYALERVRKHRAKLKANAPPRVFKLPQAEREATRERVAACRERKRLAAELRDAKPAELSAFIETTLQALIK